MPRSSESAFGEILLEFRKRQRLTQGRLAAKLGLHRNTISLWERGDYLPGSLTSILDLCQALALNEEETHHLLEARFGTFSVLPIHRLHLPRNPFFCGREELLQRIHHTFASRLVPSHMVALCGMAGIGKTELALEYAYLQQDFYRYIFFLRARNSADLLASLVRMARDLTLPESAEDDPSPVVAALQRWLLEHSRWLLILDDVRDLRACTAFLPPDHSGALLLTTRLQVVEPLARQIVVESFAEQDALAFLLRRASGIPSHHKMPFHISDAELKAAQEIITLFGAHPLALDQAGAYIAETHADFSTYRHLLNTDHLASLLQRRGAVPTTHPLALAPTFDQIWFELYQQSVPACSLLKSSVLLAHDGLVSLDALAQDPLLAPLLSDRFVWNELMRVLYSYSLLTYQQETSSLRMHPLLRIIVQQRMRLGKVCPPWSSEVSPGW